MRRVFIVACFVCSAGLGQFGNQPVAPFRIVGNLYYVGGTDICSYVIATPKGLIVIDGGYPEMAPAIRANIEKLGFHLRDVGILLNTHAHFDHAGGLAQLKRWTGRKVLCKPRRYGAARAGRQGRSAVRQSISVSADRAGYDVRRWLPRRVRRNGARRAHHSGHTPGCTTWTARIAGKDVVIIGSPTVPAQYKLTPELRARYRRTFDILKSLPCDIPLGSHGSIFDLAQKIA